MSAPLVESVSPSVRLHEEWLRVALSAGEADFHLRWLRHNCDLDRHPTTRERTLDSSELPARVRAEAAWVADEALLVRWAGEDRVSRFALARLAEHAYAVGRVEVPRPPSDIDAIRVRAEGLDLGARIDVALALLARTGVAVVRRGPGEVTPPEDETEPLIEAFAARGLKVRGTHFGRIEDLRTDNTTNQNTDQLGYTDAAVDLHTDQPFIPKPPRFQLLQSIRRADRGGESYLVDAFAAARYLASFERRAHELLRTIPVHFHRKQRAFESLVVAPILGEGEEGPIVRYSYFTMAPFRLPFDQLAEWYRAYDRYADVVRDPQNQLRFTLEPGDFLIYDNHRMLHARTAFAGPRWVRGIYFDR